MLRNAAVGLLALMAAAFAGPEIALVVAERSPLAVGLPDGDELAELLASCQITSDFGPEAALCPQAHAAEDFSPHLHAALVASEDRRFLTHDGVDPWAVLRAGLGLVGLAEPSGGSTITQQLARTLFLTREPTLGRKVREWILARRIERALGKPQILTAYLNVAPLGHGLFGFDAAARYYFGTDARSLSAMQAAMLVSMLPRPVRDPGTRPIDAYRATVARIDLMAAQDFVTEDAALAAKAEARSAILHGGLPEVAIETRRAARRPVEFRRIRDLARRQLAESGIEPGGASRIFVTMDPRFQRWTDEATASHPAGYRAAALFMSPAGSVLAVAGGDYGDQQYNAAFQARRSVGSLGKVPLYVLAHERPDLLGRSYSNAPLKGSWPREPSERCAGEMGLREALAYSCNRPFARLSAAMKGRTGEYVRTIGLSPPDDPILTALGGVHGNLLAVTSFFAAIANSGTLMPPRAAIGVADRDGRFTPAAPPETPRRVMSREVAAAVATDLRGPVRAEGGTARQAAGRARAAHVAGKTGTSDGNRDAWFVGFTADFVGGIWAYDAGEAGPRVGGGGYPAAAFGRIVDAYWVPRNAQAGLAPPRIRDTAQAAVFAWTPTRALHWAHALSRPLVVAAMLILTLCFVRPWRLQLRLPRLAWRPEGRGPVPPAVRALGPHRP